MNLLYLFFEEIILFIRTGVLKFMLGGNHMLQHVQKASVINATAVVSFYMLVCT